MNLKRGSRWLLLLQQHAIPLFALGVLLVSWLQCLGNFFCVCSAVSQFLSQFLIKRGIYLRNEWFHLKRTFLSIDSWWLDKAEKCLKCLTMRVMLFSTFVFWSFGVSIPMHTSKNDCALLVSTFLYFTITQAFSFSFTPFIFHRSIICRKKVFMHLCAITSSGA